MAFLAPKGAKVLGTFTVGHDSKIGSNSVVLKEVPPHSTVVGVPGRVVKQGDVRIADMDQIKLPDPILAEFRRLNRRIEELENKLGITAPVDDEEISDISIDIAKAEKGEKDNGEV